MNPACMVHNEAIIIAGGHVNLGEKLNTVERYSPKYDVSVYLPSMTKARSYHVLASLDGRPTVFAGSGSENGTEMIIIESFNEIRDR